MYYETECRVTYLENFTDEDLRNPLRQKVNRVIIREDFQFQDHDSTFLFLFTTYPFIIRNGVSHYFY